MSITEHLQRIRARCVELLALAENRTPGEWQDREDFTISERSGFHVASLEFGVRREADAAFIAACAGAAEAGWRSTIAAIDALDPNNPALIGVEYSQEDNAALNAILAAWPEETL